MGALTIAWEQHIARSLAPRDDGTALHASDLHSCDYALHRRLKGFPSIPFDEDDFNVFEVGHAFEGRVEIALGHWVKENNLSVERGEQVEYDGIVGNLDFSFYRGADECVGVADVSTTKKPAPKEDPQAKPEPSYGHVLKTAFYALAKGGVPFSEFVLRLGYGGVVKAYAEYRYTLDQPALDDGTTWRQAVEQAIAHVKAISGRSEAPGTIPPTTPAWAYADPAKEPVEAWRCGSKTGASYCQAICPLNMKVNGPQHAKTA